MIDSATPPCGCAQNDGIAGSIQVSDGIEGSLHSCSYGADFTHLTFPICEQHEDRGGMCVIAHFPSHFPRGYSFCPFKQHSFTKWPSGHWHLRIWSHCFQHVILHEGHSCQKLQNPPLMRMGFSVPFKRPINLSHTELLGRNHLQLSPFHFFSLSLPTSGRT